MHEDSILALEPIQLVSVPVPVQFSTSSSIKNEKKKKYLFVYYPTSNMSGTGNQTENYIGILKQRQRLDLDPRVVCALSLSLSALPQSRRSDRLHECLFGSSYDIRFEYKIYAECQFGPKIKNVRQPDQTSKWLCLETPVMEIHCCIINEQINLINFVSVMFASSRGKKQIMGGGIQMVLYDNFRNSSATNLFFDKLKQSFRSIRRKVVCDRLEMLFRWK